MMDFLNKIRVKRIEEATGINSLVVMGGGALLFFIVVIATSIMAPSMYDNEDTGVVTRSFQGNVVAFKPPLSFKLDCCDEALTLAMVKADNAEEAQLRQIESLLRSSSLSCTAYTRPDEGDRDVWCSLKSGQFVSEALFNRNLVEERCENTGNQFGTCE